MIATLTHMTVHGNDAGLKVRRLERYKLARTVKEIINNVQFPTILSPLFTFTFPYS